MNSLKIFKTIGVIFISLCLLSCDNELHMNFPKGPSGNDGLSAYELWKEEVIKGNIVWDKNKTDISNFFIYLKGEDGKNGSTGADGKSAYEQWKEEVAKGVDDPHNPGQQWSKDKISVQDFWYFLTGAKGKDGNTPTIGENGNWHINGNDTGIPAKGNDGANGENGKDGSVVTIGSNGNWFIDGEDTGVPAFGKDGSNGSNGSDGSDGQTAYELWKEEVAKGITNPHNPTENWPKNKVTVQDFWDYLRGEDGIDGKDGETIIKGKANVIAQYQVESNNEYVNWEDGSISYVVYNDEGLPAAGAIVKGLPGMDPDKTYTADSKGNFTVSKDDLPKDKTEADRFGTTASVTYTKSTGSVVTEESAKNTRVPNKMQIRIRIASAPYLAQQDMVVPYIIERRQNPSDSWEPIPSFLGDLSQTITAYVVSDANEPSSYTSTSKKLFNEKRNISANGNTISIPRLYKKEDYVTDKFKPELRWDEKDYFFTLELDSYYGEKPHVDAVVKAAPIRLLPIPNKIKIRDYPVLFGSENYLLTNVFGTFDTSHITTNYSYFFEKLYNITPNNTSTNGNIFDLYEPKAIISIDDFNNQQMLRIKFYLIKDGSIDHLANNYGNPGSINNPDFNLPSIIMDATFDITPDPNSWHFMPLLEVGKIRKDSARIVFRTHFNTDLYNALIEPAIYP